MTLEEVIAEMNYFSIIEKYYRITVGVPIRKVHEANILAVYVERHALLIGDDR